MPGAPCSENFSLRVSERITGIFVGISENFAHCVGRVTLETRDECAVEVCVLVDS